MSTYELFSSFIDRCKEIVPNDQKLLRFIIKRYNDCPNDLRISTQMQDLLHQYLDKITRDRANIFLHIQHFLDDVKRLQGLPSKPMSPSLQQLVHGLKRCADDKSGEDNDDAKKRRTETRISSADSTQSAMPVEVMEALPRQASSATVPSKPSRTVGGGDAQGGNEPIVLSDSEDDGKAASSANKMGGNPGVPTPASQATLGPVPQQLYRNQAAVLHETHGRLRGATGLVPMPMPVPPTPPPLRLPLSGWPPPKGAEWSSLQGWNNRVPSQPESLTPFRIAPRSFNVQARTTALSGGTVPPMKGAASTFGPHLHNFPLSEPAYLSAPPSFGPSGQSRPLQPLTSQNGPRVGDRAVGKPQPSKKQDSSDVICIDSDSDQEDTTKTSLRGAPTSANSAVDFPQYKFLPNALKVASPPSTEQSSDPHLEELFRSSLREVHSLGDTMSPAMLHADPAGVKMEDRCSAAAGESPRLPKQGVEARETSHSPPLVKGKEGRDSSENPKLSKQAVDSRASSRSPTKLEQGVTADSKECSQSRKLVVQEVDGSRETSASPRPPRRVTFQKRDAGGSPQLELGGADWGRESPCSPEPSSSKAASSSAKPSHKSSATSSKSHAARWEEEEPQPGPSHYVEGKQKEASDRHIRRLESLLKNLKMEIQRCEKVELDFNDMLMGDSMYLYQDKLEKKFVKVWNKLCQLKKQDTATGRPIEKKYKCKASRYDVINRKVERYINRKKEFPDYTDIRKLVNKISLREGLHFSMKKVKEVATQIFTDIGETLQKRRKEDLAYNMGYYIEEDKGQDPAAQDTELKQQLEQSRAEGRTRMEAIYDHFSQEQEKSGAEPEEVGEDTNLSEAEEGSVDEEEEGLELEDLDSALDEDSNLPELKPPTKRYGKPSSTVSKASEEESFQELKRAAKEVALSTPLEADSSGGARRKSSSSAPSPSPSPSPSPFPSPSQSPSLSNPSPAQAASASPPREGGSPTPHVSTSVGPDPPVGAGEDKAADAVTGDEDESSQPIVKFEESAKNNPDDIEIMTDDDNSRLSPDIFMQEGNLEDSACGDEGQPEPPASGGSSDHGCVDADSKLQDTITGPLQGKEEGGSGKEDAEDYCSFEHDEIETCEAEEASTTLVEELERCQENTLPFTPDRKSEEGEKEEDLERGETAPDEASVSPAPADTEEEEPSQKLLQVHPDILKTGEPLEEKETETGGWVSEDQPSQSLLQAEVGRVGEESVDAEDKAESGDGLGTKSSVDQDHAGGEAVSDRTEEAMDTEEEAMLSEEAGDRQGGGADGEKSDGLEVLDESALLGSEADSGEKSEESVGEGAPTSPPPSTLGGRGTGGSGDGDGKETTVDGALATPGEDKQKDPDLEIETDCKAETQPPSPRDSTTHSPDPNTVVTDHMMEIDQTVETDQNRKVDLARAATTSPDRDSRKSSLRDSPSLPASADEHGPSQEVEKLASKTGVSVEEEMMDVDKKEDDSDDVCVIEDEEEQKQADSCSKLPASPRKRKGDAEGEESDLEIAELAPGEKAGSAASAASAGTESADRATELPSSPKRRRGMEDFVEIIDAEPAEKGDLVMEHASPLPIPRDKLRVTNGTKLLFRTLATKTASAAAVDGKDAGTGGRSLSEKPATPSSDAAGMSVVGLDTASTASKNSLPAASASPSTGAVAGEVAGDVTVTSSGQDAGTPEEAKSTKPASTTTAPKGPSSDLGKKATEGSKGPSDKDLILIDSDSDPEEEGKKVEENKKSDSDDDVQFVKAAPAVLPRRMPPPQMTSTPKVPVSTGPYRAQPGSFLLPSPQGPRGPVQTTNPSVRVPMASNAYLQRGAPPNVPPLHRAPNRGMVPGMGPAAVSPQRALQVFNVERPYVPGPVRQQWQHMVNPGPTSRGFGGTPARVPGVTGMPPSQGVATSATRVPSNQGMPVISSVHSLQHLMRGQLMGPMSLPTRVTVPSVRQVGPGAAVHHTAGQPPPLRPGGVGNVGSMGRMPLAVGMRSSAGQTGRQQHFTSLRPQPPQQQQQQWQQCTVPVDKGGLPVPRQIPQTSRPLAQTGPTTVSSRFGGGTAPSRLPGQALNGHPGNSATRAAKPSGALMPQPPRVSTQGGSAPLAPSRGRASTSVQDVIVLD